MNHVRLARMNSPLRRSASRSTYGASPSSSPAASARSADWPRWRPFVSPMDRFARSPAHRQAGDHISMSAISPTAPNGRRGRIGGHLFHYYRLTLPDTSWWQCPSRCRPHNALNWPKDCSHDFRLFRAVAEIFQVVGCWPSGGCAHGCQVCGVGFAPRAFVARLRTGCAAMHIPPAPSRTRNDW